MDALLAHPLLILALAWAGSRLQILIEVRARVGGRFTTARYMRKRWPQIVHSAVWTLGCFGAVVATGAAEWLASAVPLDPPLTATQALAAVAFALGVAPDQVVDRLTSLVSDRRRGEAPLGTAESDITQIAASMGDTTVLAPDRAPTIRRADA